MKNVSVAGNAHVKASDKARLGWSDEDVMGIVQGWLGEAAKNVPPELQNASVGEIERALTPQLLNYMNDRMIARLNEVHAREQQEAPAAEEGTTAKVKDERQLVANARKRIAEAKRAGVEPLAEDVALVEHSGVGKGRGGGRRGKENEAALAKKREVVAQAKEASAEADQRARDVAPQDEKTVDTVSSHPDYVGAKAETPVQTWRRIQKIAKAVQAAGGRLTPEITVTRDVPGAKGQTKTVTRKVTLPVLQQALDMTVPPSAKLQRQWVEELFQIANLREMARMERSTRSAMSSQAHPTADVASTAAATENTAQMVGGRKPGQEMAHAGGMDDVGAWRPVLAVKTTLREAVAKVRDGLLGKQGNAFNTVLDRIVELAGDARVATITHGEMNRLVGRGRFSMQVTTGYHLTDNSDIYINGNLHPNFQAEAIVHEGVHAVTVRALLKSPRLRSEVADLMEQIKAHVEGDPSFAFPDVASTGVWERAMNSPAELLAIALSDLQVAQALDAIPVPSPKSWVRTALDALVDLITNALDLTRAEFNWSPRRDNTALKQVLFLAHAAMNEQSRLETVAELQQRIGAPTLADRIAETKDQIYGQENVLHSAITSGLNRVMARTVRMRTPGYWALGALNLDVLTDIYKGEFNWTAATAARKVADTPLEQAERALLRRGTVANAIRENFGGGQIINRLIALSQAEQTALADLWVDSTMAKVWPTDKIGAGRNGHLNATRLKDAAAVAAHAGLEARFNALSSEAQALYVDTLDAFQKMHTDIVTRTAENLLDTRAMILDRSAVAAGKPVAPHPNLKDMAQRFLTRSETQADIDWAGDAVVEAMKDVRGTTRMAGPYFGLRRFGDFVVTWFEDPTNNSPTITSEYATEADATAAVQAAVAAGRMVTDAKAVYYDNATGERARAADWKANPAAFTQRFAVTLQNQGVSFFETAADANEFRDDLLAQGKTQVRDRDLRQYDPAERQARLPPAWGTLLKSLEQHGLTGNERAVLEAVLQKAAAAILPDNNVASSHIRRRNVLGASRDAKRAIASYASSGASYLAHLEMQPQLRAALQAMEEHTRAHAYAGHDKTEQRQRVIREIRERVSMDAVDQFGGASTNRFVRALQQYAFVNFLASPAYSIINSMQFIQVTIPDLASRYGLSASLRAVAAAQSLVSPRGLFRLGLSETLRAAKRLKTGEGRDDAKYISIVRDNVRKSGAADATELLHVLDEVGANGRLDLTAGFEIASAARGDGGPIARRWAAVYDMARSMPAATEVMMRATAAIAAYRLARAKGATVEEGVKEADRAIRETLFDMSSTNTARWFDARRNPMLAPVLVFKKFALGMYSLLARSAYLAFKGATPEVRKAAAFRLGGMAIAHAALAGATGMPIEPISIIAGMVAFMMGEDDPPDVLEWLRRQLVDVVGEDAAQLIARGPVGVVTGIDIATRVGLSNLIFQKELRDFKPESMAGWAAHFMFGAPGAAALQPMTAMQQMNNGDFGGAVQSVLPLKGLRDIVKAARFMDVGVRDRRGNTLLGSETFNPAEVAFQAVGFTPERVTEMHNRRRAVQDARMDIQNERARLMRAYAQAEPGDRAVMLTRIQRWNEQQPQPVRITMMNLQQSISERRRQQRQSQGAGTSAEFGGLYLPRRYQHLLETHGRGYD